MLENFSTAFVLYFVVIDPIGNSPIFLAITAHLSKRQKNTNRCRGQYRSGGGHAIFRTLRRMDSVLSGRLI
jgi:small neutral amino acid transporter SnatA (MarC family)